MKVPEWLRIEVVIRAQDRCEYCGLSQRGQEATFHIDHIHPVSLGGDTELENLALACVSCSLRKAARTQAQDPMTGDMAPLFHPRKDAWNLHFRWMEEEVVGITVIGRATVTALMMNRPGIVAIRAELARLGRHPPEGLL